MLLVSRILLKDKSMAVNKIFIIFIALNLIACVEHQARPQNVLTTCVFPNHQEAPGWICAEPVAGLDLQAVGVVDKSVAGLNYMRDMAKIAAVKQLTELFKIRVAKVVTQYLTAIQVENELVFKAGQSTVQTISNKTLAGAKQYQSKVGPEGRMYVLAGLDNQTVRSLLEDAVKISMQNDPVLWEGLQAKKSLAEMVAEIAEMDVQLKL